MSRWKAFAIHFSMSLAVFIPLLAIILLVWYPGILFSIDGGWAGLRIVIGVDLVLGPLLTLVVFKAGKKGLRFDLTCIAVAQIACMAAGMWIVYKERPIALVLAYDTFYTLAAGEYEDLGKDSSVLDTIEGPYPKLIYIELPENEIAADIASIRSQFIGDPLFMQTENYRPIPTDSEEAEAVFRREQSVRNTLTDEFLEQFPEGCLLSKLISAVTSGYVCYDAELKALSQFADNPYGQTEADRQTGAESN